MSNYLPINKNIQNLSRQLRNNATKEENRLWYEYLRTYHIRFNRQYIIDNYIVDFYCKKAKLVIEIDGSQHFEKDAILYDNLRTLCFANLGIDVLRFTNSDITNDLDAVARLIDKIITERIFFISE